MSTQSVVSGFRLAWASRTEVGKVRQVNEDSILVRPGLFVVADGMGGHAAGDVASQITIENFEQADHYPDVLPITELADVLNAANLAVIEHAQQTHREGMGSTIVGAAVVDNGGDPALMIFHVGDSRCYVLEGGVLRQVTRDHSHVQELVDNGEITEAEAINHPHRNVVTRAIGIEPTVFADYVVLADVAKQRLMLCSDGVSGEVGFHLLQQTLAGALTVDEAADELMALVLSGRASDNASVVVVDVERQPVNESDEPDPDVTGPRLIRPTGDWRPPAPMISDVPATPSEVTTLSPTGLDVIDEVPC